jgi:hypothetical protein
MAKVVKKPRKSISSAKSAKTGANSLDEIYESLSEVLARYAPPFKLCDMGVRNKRSVQLVVPKPVAIPGAYGGKPTNVPLAAVIVRKGFVGLYLMCIYMNPAMRKKISPALLKLLKGKSCFHLKKLDEGLMKDVEAALEAGAAYYAGRGWI